MALFLLENHSTFGGLITSLDTSGLDSGVWWPLSGLMLTYGKMAWCGIESTQMRMT